MVFNHSQLQTVQNVHVLLLRNSYYFSWFSGIKAKLSQLTGISEWMNQLGIGNSPGETNNLTMRRTSAAVVQTNNDCNDCLETMEDVISYGSIKLDEIAQTPEVDYGSWDWNTCLLADLDASHQWNDTLERQHFGPLSDLVIPGEAHRGEGHTFQCINLLHPTWCDKCGDFIWGILRQAVKCEKCNYTCHQRCQELVTLDCRSAGSSLDSGEYDSIYPKLNDGTLGTIPENLKQQLAESLSESKLDQRNGSISVENHLFSIVKSGAKTLPKAFAPVITTLKQPIVFQAQNGRQMRVQELFVKEDTPYEWTSEYQDDDLAAKIQAFNAAAEEGSQLVMSSDAKSFSGHIQVHMNFTRPISIVAGENPPSVYDVRSTGTSTMKQRTITSFFLPRNTVKTININSTMTTRQMIVTLLRKFRVADNPRKFALYESSLASDENTLMRKLVKVADDVCPLRVVLNWFETNSFSTLVLQENDTGDIMWDAFEVPELENFLRILSMEEQQYSWQIKQRFRQYENYLNNELRARGLDVDVGPSYLNNQQEQKGYQEEIDPFGTSDSLIVSDVFHTLKDSFDEPTYVNMEEMKREQSTRL
ncbi:unnamed protein product [Auanema sp. JU1783]|nr:unnamed protein product [Auanema sp. JU1783]